MTREEVKRAVWKICNGKAAGQDEVEAKLMKNGEDAAIDWLTEVVQQVWQSGKVPQEWKDATLIPVHKKWARNDCDDYSGISLFRGSTKPYYSVDYAVLVAVLRSYRIPNQLVNLVGELYTVTKCCVRTTEAPQRPSKLLG